MERRASVEPSYSASIRDEKRGNETMEEIVVANMFTNAASATGSHTPFPLSESLR